MSTLSEHLKYSVKGKDNVNESLILEYCIALPMLQFAMLLLNLKSLQPIIPFHESLH